MARFKVYIHKNEIKEKIRGKWQDVPEFVEFISDNAGWVQGHEELPTENALPDEEEA